MKIFTLILSIPLLVCSVANAQNCNIARNEVDKFTGHKIITTEEEVLISGFKVTLSKYDNDTFLQLSIGSMNAYSVDEGKDLIILFDDATKLVLKNLKYTLSDARNIGGMTYFVASLHFSLDSDAIAQLKSKSVQSLRAYTNSAYEQCDVKKRSKLKIGDMLMKVAGKLNRL